MVSLGQKKEIAKHIKDNNILYSIMYNIKYSAGFMLETDKPHINKKIAYLCYHLSYLKPFSASKMDDNFYQDVEQMDYIENHFNEVIIYFIIIIRCIFNVIICIAVIIFIFT